MFGQFDTIILQASDMYNVPFLWIKAFIGTESSFNPNAVRQEPTIADASRGLMQMLERTARGLGLEGPIDQLFDPAVSIFYGTKLMRELIDSYGTDFRRIYSAYNSGEPDTYLTSEKVAGNVQRAEEWLEKFATGGGLAFTTAAVPLLLVGAFALLITKK